MPSYLELTREEVLDTRERLEDFIRIGFPDIDLQANTVLGDLIITPQAYTVAAVEKGMDRFMSDLNLANVADGIIYNCDFVEKYLGNFAASKEENLQGSGVIRLVFSQDKEYILDRSTRFSSGNESDNMYGMYMPHEGPVHIYKVGTQVPEGVNFAVLHDSGSNSFFADIPVLHLVGEEPIRSGSRMLVNKIIPELGAITALTDLTTGYAEITLPQLAKRTRSTIYSASMTTRNGAVRFLETNCPFVDGAYAIKDGDREMIRSYRYQCGCGTDGCTCSATYGVATGCIDLYVRSSGYEFTEQQYVTLTRREVNGKYYWCGEWDYTGQPYHWESITNTGEESVEDLPHVVISTTKSGLGGLSAYTSKERLYILVKDSPNYDYFLAQNELGETERRAQFLVTYQTDPMHRAIEETVEDTDNKPVNTSVMVRGFIPVIIDGFNVEYVKQQGVVPLLSEARDSIAIYLANISYPDTFSTAKIADIMGIAGAKYTKGIKLVGRVQWSVADVIGRYECDEVPFDPSVIPSEASKYARVTDNAVVDELFGAGVLEQEAKVTLRSEKDMYVYYPPKTHDITADDMFACSVKNIRYYLMENAITFTEIKETK